MSSSSTSSSAGTTDSAIVFTELQACLILNFPSRLTSELSAKIEVDTLKRCASGRHLALIFDLSALELIDLTEWNWLRKVARSVYLLGAETWFVGVRPPIITTLITLNADIHGVHYALGVEEAIMEVSSTHKLFSSNHAQIKKGSR